MKHLLTIIVVGLLLSAIASCEQEEAAPAGDALAGHELPSMVTRDVSMLVSDSGVIRYRATTPAWFNYGNDSRNKYQYFPEGINIISLDSAMMPTASIYADTAYNYEAQQLWHLIRNVRIRNLQDEEFQTNDLFWDMKNGKVYSDSFIHIERPDAIIEGYGFTSNDDFSKYELRQTSGVFPMRSLDNAGAADTAALTPQP